MHLVFTLKETASLPIGRQGVPEPVQGYHSCRECNPGRPDNIRSSHQLRHFVGIRDGKKHVGKPKRRWRNKIKINIREKEWEVSGSIRLDKVSDP
jgi:hypothetical protein